MYLVVMSLLLLLSAQVFAASPCLDKLEIFENTMVQTLPNKTGCLVSVSPVDTNSLVYRSFLFDNIGLFMIFDSFGEGSESETTGAREFYFFPHKTNEISYRYDIHSQHLSVKSPSGKVFIFNAKKSILVSASNSSLTIDYAVNRKNKGGIEFIKNDAFYLDLDFKMGQSPSQNPNGEANFKDVKQNSCIVKNSDIFKYTSDQDPLFKYDDAHLRSFLRKNCPKINL